MTEQPFDVRGAARVVARSWRTLALFVLVGLLAAGGYLASSLPRYTATSLVLLPPSTSSASGTSTSASRPVTVDAKVATSAAVLLPAARTAAPSETLSQLQSRVNATSVASGVLQISATASSGRQAERLANAVASQLVAFVTANGSAANGGVIAGLEAENRQLGHQLAVVQAEERAATKRIATEGAGSAAGVQDRALLGNLSSQAASLSLQVSSVRSQIATAQLGQTSANLGTQVIQRATTATPPSVLSLALPLIVGLLGGALVGSVVLLVFDRSHPKVRTRDGMAMAFGAPVVLALDVVERHTLGSWAQLLESDLPGPLETWNVGKALRELGSGLGERQSLVILAFDEDRAALTEAVQVAVTAAASGIATELSITAPDRVADTLRAACARYEREERNPRPGLIVHDGPITTPHQTTALSVTVMVIDVDNPAGSLGAPCPAGARAVVAVSSGFASAEELTRAGMAATSAGTPIRAICLANPEARDTTVGRFPIAGGTNALVEHRRPLRNVPSVAMERP